MLFEGSPVVVMNSVGWKLDLRPELGNGGSMLKGVELDELGKRFEQDQLAEAQLAMRFSS
jgi:hypothetical protein